MYDVNFCDSVHLLCQPRQALNGLAKLLNRPQWCCTLVGPKRRKGKDGRTLGKPKQEEGRSPSSCPPEGAPPRGRCGPKTKTSSAFLGTLCAIHKEGTDDMQQCITSSRKQLFLQATNARIVHSQKRKSRREGVHQMLEHVSEIRCQALCQGVRTSNRRETLNREIHPQKRNHHRSVNVVSSRSKTVGVLRPKPGGCHGRDPKTQRQQRTPRQSLKLLCSRLCKGI